MKRLISLFAALAVIFTASALDIPQGKFYFDNSLTQYTHVKFVYGNTSDYSRVISMTDEGNDRWSVTIDEAEADMYRYTFAETSLADGVIEQSFLTTKDYISNDLNEKRTATCEDEIPVGWVFTPSSGDNWAQGVWMSPNAANGYSGTLPVIFINTENGEDVTSKEEYLNATYYLDAMGVAGFESVGTAEEPLVLQIKGRGNYTWTGFDKKPYRLKLDKKAGLLGMPKNKHWALLAHADDEMAWLRNTVGFSLSRRLGMKWTPGQQPVEVVLNGKYWGLYMLTELIRIEPDRVNITEQEDYEADPANVTGGWLVEIDNYQEDEQVRITEGNGKSLWFTYKSPELLSDVQREYLTNFVTAVDAAIYNENKNDNSWENLVDVDELVKFYLVQEILDNAESFHGSCYWYKDRGDDTKMTFGPVWDFGNTFRRRNGQFIYQNPPYGQTWIGEIAKYPHFQELVQQRWKEFLAYDQNGLDEEMDAFATYIASAAQSDAARWPQYNHANVAGAKQNMKNSVADRIAWLKQQWGEPDMSDLQYDVNRDGAVNGSDVTTLYNQLLDNIIAAGNADVNRDGVVNGSDVTALYQKLLGETDPGPGPDPEDDDSKYVTIYVQADEAPYLYAWTYNPSYQQFFGDWPGTQLSETVEKDGTIWYKARIDADEVSIIFNNGQGTGAGVQTDNIDGLTRGSVYYFSYDGASGYEVIDEGGGGGDPQPGDDKIYIYVQADEAPHLYAWTSVNGRVTQHHGEWPGELMDETVTLDDGTTWFKVEFDLDNMLIIFNNGGFGTGNQTADIPIPARGSYFFIYDGGDQYELLNSPE